VVNWIAWNLVSESIETTSSLQNTTNQCDHSKRVHWHVLLNVAENRECQRMESLLAEVECSH